jgi:predicted nucleotidyltransferase
VKYFQLCMENNPNMIDSLFTPEFCVLHSTRISTLLREKRKMFLHKGHWPKFKGYAYQQMHKALIKNPEPGSKRAAVVEKFGFDVKFMYHTVRLLYEAEQILTTGDLDLQRDREHLKAIRAGEQTLDYIRDWASAKEKALEEAYNISTLPWGPPEKEIKELLLTCLEEHYGSLDKCVIREDAALRALREVSDVIQRYQKLLAQ